VVEKLAIAEALTGTLHYLSKEEEAGIKRSIPWKDIDEGIRDIVALANSIDGIVTKQSCAGHVKHLLEDGEGTFYVQSANITFRANLECTVKALFDLIPRMGFLDACLRYFGDWFWISIDCDPSERGKLREFFERLKAWVEE
jgi:hypothetical protein